MNLWRHYVHLGSVYRAVPAVAGYLLAAEHGAGAAALQVGVAGAFASLLGVLLLRTSPTGRIGWQNRAAAPLLPWAHVLGGGSLARLAVTSWVFVCAVGAAGAYGRGAPWLLAAWLLDLIAAAYLARVLVRSCHAKAQRRVVGFALAMVVALALAGLAASAAGHPLLGAVIAGGPLAAIGMLWFAWASIFLMARPSSFR